MPEPTTEPTIWFVNSYFYPDHAATSQILSDVAFFLADTGREVKVIANQRSYDGGSQYAPKELVKGVDITRLPSLGPSGRGMMARLGRYLGMYLGASWQILTRVQSGDIVVCKTDPPLMSIPLGIAARLRGAKLVNWLQDLYPEVAQSLGMRLPRPVRWLLTSLRNWSLKIAAANVAIGECMARLLRQEGVPADKIVILTNFVDDEHILAVPSKNPLRKEWQLEGKFVLAYSGNLGRAHDIETFIGMAEILRDRDDIAFLFIGGGHFVEQLRERLTKMGLKNVRFEGYQPRDKLNLSLALPDAHWVSLLPEMEGLIVPSKIYGIMAAGRPMIAICSPEGEMAQMIDRADIGVQIDPGDAPAFARAVIQLAESSTLTSQLGANARSDLDANFSRAKVMQGWEKLLERIA